MMTLSIDPGRKIGPLVTFWDLGELYCNKGLVV